jgi:hypothetical protein
LVGLFDAALALATRATVRDRREPTAPLATIPNVDAKINEYARAEANQSHARLYGSGPKT